jgi:hypothetical protein
LAGVPLLMLSVVWMRGTRRDWPVLTGDENYFVATILFQVLLLYYFLPTTISPFIYFQF